MKLAFIMAWALMGLAQPASEQAPPDQVISFSASDSAMSAAEDKGRATLPEFFARYSSPAADETEFMVKYDVDPTEGFEFVWASLLSRSGSTVQGILINQPVKTKDKLGDKVAIQEADIVDWGYRKAGVMQGSFTTRVMLDQMPSDEADQYRDFLGW